MTPEKRMAYINNLARVRDLYFNTDMKISQIARSVKLSETTCHKMVEGKHPKWYVKYLAIHAHGRGI